EARDIESARGRARASEAEERAQNLPADAAADHARQRVGGRPEGACARQVAGDVAAHRTAQKLDQKINDVHGWLPPCWQQPPSILVPPIAAAPASGGPNGETWLLAARPGW